MRRHAIVTGSDSGIGKATAIALAEAGYDVGDRRRRLIAFYAAGG